MVAMDKDESNLGCREIVEKNMLWRPKCRFVHSVSEWADYRPDCHEFFYRLDF